MRERELLFVHNFSENIFFEVREREREREGGREGGREKGSSLLMYSSRVIVPSLFLSISYMVS